MAVHTYTHKLSSTTMQCIVYQGSWSWDPVLRGWWKWEILRLEWESNPHLLHSRPVCCSLHHLGYLMSSPYPRLPVIGVLVWEVRSYYYTFNFIAMSNRAFTNVETCVLESLPPDFKGGILKLHRVMKPWHSVKARHSHRLDLTYWT